MKCQSLILASLILGIFLISIVSAETLVSDVGVEYESELLEEFENQTWVRIIVDLKDNSGITIAGTKEERRNLSRQRDKWFEPVIGEVLALLLEDEFGYKGKLSDGFGGSITKKGFGKLINDERVRAIYQDVEVYAALEENGGTEILVSDVGVNYEPEILEEFKNQTRVRVIVRVKDLSNIVITGTKEEKIELMKQRYKWFEPVVDEVLATFLEDEFDEIRRLSTGFGVTLTKKGFGKLINDERVRAIYQDVEVYAGENGTASEEDTNKTMGTEEIVMENDKEDAKLSFFQKITNFFRKLLSLIGIK